MHPQPVVYDGRRVRRRAHPRRADQVVGRDARLPRMVHQLVIGLCMRSGQRFCFQKRSKLWRGQHPPHEAHPGQRQAPVLGVGHVVRLHDGVFKHVRGCGLDIARALWPMRPCPGRHARIPVQYVGPPRGVAAGCEHALQVGRRVVVIPVGKHMHVGRRGTQDAWPAQRPPCQLPRQAGAACHLVQGNGAGPGAHDEPHGIMVAQVLAGRQHCHGRYPQPLQHRRRANAAHLQQPRRVDRAGTQQDLPPGHDGPGRRVPAGTHPHAHGAPPVPHQGKRAGVGPYLEVRAPSRRHQIAACRTHPAAARDRALKVADARLVAAVVIGVARHPQAHAPGHECLAERVDPVLVRYRDRPVRAARFGIAARPAFGLLKIRQHVGVAPAAVAPLRPAIEIGRLAAIVDHAVYGAGPA